MAKSLIQSKAEELRKSGKSINEITKELLVSKSSVSRWCKDIKLSEKQIQRLDEKIKKGSYRGRMKGALTQRKRKEEKILKLERKALSVIKRINASELLIAGLSLYWGEGNRKNPGVRFFNSDPEIIKFIMKWFRNTWKLKNDRFLIYISINEIHRERISNVIGFWSKITGIPKDQFKKPIFIKTANKKVYGNFNQHYGTLSIRISKSTDLYYEIMALIKALSTAG